MPSSGRCDRMRSTRSASLRRSISVTTSVALDLVAATVDAAASTLEHQRAGLAALRRSRGRAARRAGRVVVDVTPILSDGAVGWPCRGQPAAEGRTRHRAGSGSSRAGRRRATDPGARAPATRPSPTRSSTSSRTIATNRGSVPTVAARSAGSPSAARVAERHRVEVPHHLHVVAHEPDRHDARPRGRRSAAQRGEVVADVGLEPRDLRRARPRLVHEVPAASCTGVRAATPAATRAATARCWATYAPPSGPLVSADDVGIEWVVKTSRGVATPCSSASADALDDGVDHRLDEARVVEEVPQLVQRAAPAPRRRPRPRRRRRRGSRGTGGSRSTTRTRSS